MKMNRKFFGIITTILIASMAVLFNQNCSQSNLEGSTSHPASSLPISDNSNSKFVANLSTSELCHRWVDGNDSNGIPTWAPLKGQCSQPQDALFFSVTHENQCNTHLACKDYPNDLNYKENIHAYMSDYNPQDIGTWIKYSAIGNKIQNHIQLSIDTINYSDMINRTGRPVSDGYMFFGFAELGLNNIANLSDELIIEFEYKIHISELNSDQKSGNRLMLGAALIWDEPKRTNKSHYFEINLFKTDGYHSLHFDPNQCTKDATYDHCYYDSNGKWAEGKYVSTYTALGFNTPTIPDNEWRRVEVDIFKLVRRFDWHHKPVDWKEARLDGIYMGVESRDKSLIYVSLRNFKTLHRTSSNTILPPPQPMPTPNPLPSPLPITKLNFNSSTHPIGFFRDNLAGLHSDGISICYFTDGTHMTSTGYNQEDYTKARIFSLKEILLPSIGACKSKERYGLVRSNQIGLIKHQQGFCLLTSGDHLKKCGFRQQDYDSAPNINISSSILYQSPACACH